MVKNRKASTGHTVPVSTLKIGDSIVLEDGDSAEITSIGSIDHIITENVTVCVLGYKYTSGKREGTRGSSPLKGDDEIAVRRSTWDVLKAIGRVIAGRWVDTPEVNPRKGFIPNH